MKAQRADERLTIRLPAEARAQFRALARANDLSESALLNRLISGAIYILPPPAGEEPYRVADAARAERLSVRLYPDDRLLLADRAAARGLPVATYLSALARAHLRRLAPLPEVERQALGQCVTSLSMLGRNLNQIARVANRDGVVASLTRSDLAKFIQVCTITFERFKALIKANEASWEAGYEIKDR